MLAWYKEGNYVNLCKMSKKEIAIVIGLLHLFDPYTSEEGFRKAVELYGVAGIPTELFNQIKKPLSNLVRLDIGGDV